MKKLIAIPLCSIFLYLGFSDLIGNLFNSQFDESPEKWLVNAFGSEATTNSIVFYPEKYPLGLIKHTWVISINDRAVDLVSVDKNIFQVYVFTPKRISISGCEGLSNAVNELKLKLTKYETDKDLILADNKEASSGLDLPTFSLVEFEKENVVKSQWSGGALLEYGKASDLAEKVYSVALSCKKKLTSR